MSGKIELELKNYPRLARALQDNPEAVNMLKGFAALADHSVKYIEQSEKVFDRRPDEIAKEMLDAFFDYRGILKHHDNKAEREAMEYLEQQNNPLAIFTGYATAYDAKGKPITPEQFSGMNDFNFKEWLQGMLYAARYIDHKSYARYLQLQDIDLTDAMRFHNVEKLIKVQPALAYQHKHDLPVGLFLPGTGFFDCGETEEETCPACLRQELQELNEYKYCERCTAGFKGR